MTDRQYWAYAFISDNEEDDAERIGPFTGLDDAIDAGYEHWGAWLRARPYRHAFWTGYGEGNAYFDLRAHTVSG